MPDITSLFLGKDTYVTDGWTNSAVVKALESLQADGLITSEPSDGGSANLAKFRTIHTLTDAGRQKIKNQATRESR